MSTAFSQLCDSILFYCKFVLHFCYTHDIVRSIKEVAVLTTGDRMKARRKELKLSAEDVATALNVSRATIFRYEKGDIEKLPGTSLEPLAKVLQTTVAYLMGWSDESSPAGVTPSSANLVTIHYAGPVAAHFNATSTDVYEQRTIPAEWIGRRRPEDFWPRSAATVCTRSSRTATKSCACDAATWAFPVGSALCCWAAMKPLSSVSNISQARIGSILFPSIQNSSQGVSKV